MENLAAGLLPLSGLRLELVPAQAIRPHAEIIVDQPIHGKSVHVLLESEV